jgi:hypothetical protein
LASASATTSRRAGDRSRDAILLLGDLERRGLVVDVGVRAGEPRLHLREDDILLERRQADHDGDAEAVEHDKPSRAGLEGERVRGDHVGPLEPRRIDAVAEQQRAGGDAALGGESRGGLGLAGGVGDRHGDEVVSRSGGVTQSPQVRLSESALPRRQRSGER